MGVDAADFDNDGDEDLFMTPLQKETNILYLNDGTGRFEDQSSNTKLAVPSVPFTGFGTAFFDYDNDGWLDVLALTGHVSTIEALAKVNDPYPLHQRNQLFHNLRDGRFEDVTKRAGKVFELSEVSRGGAFGDVDNDGDTDVLVVNNNGRARLLINRIGNRYHWLACGWSGASSSGTCWGRAWVCSFPEAGPFGAGSAQTGVSPLPTTLACSSAWGTSPGC